MEINRDRYLRKLDDMRGSSFVKAVTGMRRCGKSYLLLTMFPQHLRGLGVADDHIVKVDLDGYFNQELREPRNLYQYLVEHTKGEGTYYILIDEVQLVTDFAAILNEFLRRPNVDIYVTGSNARLLSKDIVTEFRGRGHEIRMYPLSFSEYASAYGGTPQRALDEYMTYGGLPQIFQYPTAEAKSQFLRSLYAETYVSDIRDRYGIRNDDDLDELMSLVASNIGCLTNPKRLADTFRSVKRSDMSYDTLKLYLDYMEDAFLVSRATRYDIKGNRYIDTPLKYYYADMGLRNARLNFRQTEPSHLMENVVYNELLYRGFQVDVGVVPVRQVTPDGHSRRVQLEVDFVCNQGSRRYYVQSALAMPTPEKVEQEKASLLRVGDFFKRVIVTGEDIGLRRDEHGITTISLADFLLDQNSLDR